MFCVGTSGVSMQKISGNLSGTRSQSNCDIISIHEMKRSNFDLPYIKKFCPRSFDDFCYLPSVGASGGILVVWKSSIFIGTEIFQNNFAISVEFSSRLNNDTWVLTSVYGPCDTEGREIFMNWFGNIQVPDDMDWLIVGDFNLIRKPEDRNRPGENMGDMLMFNDAISSLGIMEIPLHGRKFTWTNKQQPPLLERLHWFFSSQAWTLRYPHTLAHSLIMETSDHWPCVIENKTSIPKGKIFRFENYWISHDSFVPLVANSWNGFFPQQDVAKLLIAKFKSLKSALRSWQAQLSNLKIYYCKC